MILLVIAQVLSLSRQEFGINESVKPISFQKASLDCEIFSRDDVSHQSQLTEGSVCNLLANPVLASHHQVGGGATLGGLGEAEEPLDGGELGPVDPGGGEEDRTDLLLSRHQVRV